MIETEIEFTKMHGCGNDYIYINCFDAQVNNLPELSMMLCDRRKYIGGDGIITIEKSQVADAKMRIFNKDGSEGKMCGNGIRCVAKYLYDNKICNNMKNIKIETLSGVKYLDILENNNELPDGEIYEKYKTLQQIRDLIGVIRNDWLNMYVDTDRGPRILLWHIHQHYIAR